MLKNDDATRMVQHLRTLSMAYAACHHEYIESLKGTDKDTVAVCRTKMVKAYKDLDQVAKAIKEELVRKPAEVIPFRNGDKSWGKFIHAISKIQNDIDESF